MSAPGTRQKLFSLIEDVEIVTKELLENLSMTRAQRAESGIDTSQLIELLVQKDKELQESLSVAKEQAELQKKHDALKEQVNKRDHEIKQLQKSLKEAETILSTAIYQAKQKLESIRKASKRKLSTDELIKYAHVISASHAVAAPPTWMPGDLSRRPYPIDLDMRRGWLAGVQTGDLPIIPPQQQTPQHHQQPVGAASLSWQHPTNEMQPHSAVSTTPPSGGYPQVIVETKGHIVKEEVEIMSSDSSSSSSSDE